VQRDSSLSVSSDLQRVDGVVQALPVLWGWSLLSSDVLPQPILSHLVLLYQLRDLPLRLDAQLQVNHRGLETAESLQSSREVEVEMVLII